MRLIGVFVLFVLGCHPKVPVNQCGQMVEVVATNLDGCSYLFHTTEGEKLLPINGSEYQLEEYQQVAIEYEHVPDGVSICMAEDHIVRITCFDSRQSIPRKKPCLDIVEPMIEETWLQPIAKDLQPNKIDKYTYLDGFAYLCQKGNNVQIYDCQGNLLCSNSDDGECQRLISMFGDKINIWTAHR